MKSRIFFLLIFSLFFSIFANSQDIIRTKTDTIKAKVLEIGLDEIKFRNYNNLDGPIVVISKYDVYEITFENGTKMRITPDPYDVNIDVTLRNKSRSIKFEFFSPLTNDIAFGYETMLKVGTNLEFKAAVIGPGVNQNTKKTSGFFVKAGVKFLNRPSYTQRGVKHVHQLNGGYIKPEIIFNMYSYDFEDYNYSYPYTYPVTKKTVRVSYTNLAADIVFGKQHILGNFITLDYYFGFGYGIRFANKKANSPYDYSGNDSSYEYSHVFLGKTTPLVLTTGLTIGVLF